MRQASIFVVAAVAGLASAVADPLITPPARLVARDDDPQLVGYIESDTGDVRTCDYTAAFSSSGAYAQCCVTTGTNSGCNFFTACSANTLFGPSGSVACDYTSASMCNTAIVVTSSGADSGLSFLGCWQTDLGSSAFTIVRDTAAVPVAPSSGAAASSGGNSPGVTVISGTNQPSSTASGSNTATAAGTSSKSTGAAPTVGPIMGQLGALGLLAFLF